MMKSRGQENGREGVHFHEREGGMVRKSLVKVKSSRGISSELPSEE